MGRGLPRSAAVLASIAGGGAVVHFSVHQCTGFGAFHCTPKGISGEENAASAATKIAGALPTNPSQAAPRPSTNTSAA